MPNESRPNSEIDDMLKHVDERFKYNLLRANFITLAQSYHNMCKMIGATSHSDKFQDCENPTCEELIKTLNLTRL
jgi:hypothetical protein